MLPARWVWALAIAAASPAAAQVPVSIGPGGSGTATFAGIGTSNIESVGQTLTSPGGALTIFDFRVATVTTGGTVRFVFAPLTGMTAGTPLYTSADTLVSANTTLSFSGFYVPTTAGARYIGYLTSYGATGPAVDYGVRVVTSDPYLQGSLVFANSGAADPTGTAFGIISPPYDLAFTATFDTPEPAAWALMIGGFAVTGAALRRRRRIAAA